MVFSNLSILIVLFSIIAFSIVAQPIPKQDSIIYKALADNDSIGLQNQLALNKDSHGKLYMEGIRACLQGQYADSEKLLSRVATDSTSPYRLVAKTELLSMLYANGQYKKLIQLSALFQLNPATFDDAALFSTFPATEINFIADSDKIPFQLRHKSYTIITILLNGKLGRFIMDTGCTQTILTDRMARLAGINVIPTNSQVTASTNQSITGGSGFLNQLSFGNLAVKNLPVKVFPNLMALPFPFSLVLGRIDGFLGLDVLRHLRYTLDFKTKTCVLEKPVKQPGAASKKLFAGISPLLYASTITNQPLYFFYDSGSDDFQLTQYAKNKLYDWPTKKVKHKNYGLNHTKFSERVDQIKDFRFLSDTTPVSVPKATYTSRNYHIISIPVDGVIGNRPFYKGKLTIDFPNGIFSYSN